MGGPLLASHGIISNVRRTFASEYSLLCVPNLFNEVLMMINPLPRQGVDLIKSMEIQCADPLTRRPRNGLFCKPCLAALPLLLDPAPVRSLVGILQPSYGRPVARLVQARSFIMGQSGSIFSQIWRACNRLGLLPSLPLLGSPPRLMPWTLTQVRPIRPSLLTLFHISQLMTTPNVCL